MGVVDKVFHVIEEHFGVGREGLLNPSRGIAQWSHCRYIAMYCLWHYSDLHPVEITTIFNRDRTVVYKCVDYINGKCKIYPEFRKEIIEIETMITQ